MTSSKKKSRIHDDANIYYHQLTENNKFRIKSTSKFIFIVFEPNWDIWAAPLYKVPFLENLKIFSLSFSCIVFLLGLNIGKLVPWRNFSRLNHNNLLWLNTKNCNLQDKTHSHIIYITHFTFICNMKTFPLQMVKCPPLMRQWQSTCSFFLLGELTTKGPIFFLVSP